MDATTTQRGSETAPCPHCGSPVEDGFAKCGACRKLVSAAPSAPVGASTSVHSVGTTTCPHCGSPVEDGFAKCGACRKLIVSARGNRLGAPAATVEDQVGQLKIAREAVRAPPSGPSAWDTVGHGITVVVKLIVTVLWLGFIVLGFTAGVPWLGVIGIAYLAYLWLFGGRWVIY